MVIAFSDERILLDRESIDPRNSAATARLIELLGPVWRHSDAGLNNTREAHWLASGVVLVTNKNDGRLVSFFVCFDELNSSPYPDIAVQTPVFAGKIEVLGSEFRGCEREAELLRIAGVTGFAGMLSADLGTLHLGFDLRAPREKKRTRSLVQIVAEWRPL